MKRLALVAILLLIGSVAVAQQDMGHASVQGAGYLTGVVETTTSDSMTIRKDSGDVVTLLLDDGTVGRADRPVGSRVRVDFRVDSQNRAIANVIQGASPLVAEAAATMPLGSATPAAPVETPAAPAIETPAAPAVESATVEPAATAAPAATSLPATASVLPGLALLGLLAVSGAVTLRAVR